MTGSSAELFSLLESSDQKSVEEVKQVINEYLGNTKDSFFLNGLVDYYLTTRSHRCLEVLVGIKEPYDKYLFDKIVDCMKGNTRLQALLLLAHIVPKQPCWLHKVANHRILPCLLGIFKNETEVPHIMLVINIIVSLMPMIPVQYAAFLQDTFEAFSFLASLCTKKPSKISQMHMLYLNVGLYTLFQKLYSMYPCNFLAYLRCYYGSQDRSRDNISVFTETIRPLLERVRLHPLLVTASKEAELGPARWRKLETHDIIAECAKHIIDPIEGSSETNISTGGSTFSSTLSQDHVSSTPQTVDAKPSSGSAQPVRPLYWSPAETCGLTTPPPTFSPAVTAKPQSPESTLPLDLAIEATPEDIQPKGTLRLIAEPISPAVPKTLHFTEVLHGDNPLEIPDTIREEDNADKEVREINDSAAINTSSTPKDTRNDTPFYSTTHTLTVEPRDSVAELPEYHDQLKTDSHVAKFVQNISRLRYFSQCVLTSEVLKDYSFSGRQLVRSQSCPSLTKEAANDKERRESKSAQVALANIKPEFQTESGNKTGQENSPVQILEESPLKLFTFALGPLGPYSGSGHPGLSRSSSVVDGNLSLANLSPNELLEKHLLITCDNYIKEMNVAHSTWQKEFGRSVVDPGPAHQNEEINCLRGQITLLYTQLLYERHRRDIHIERNRRMLGKAKKLQVLEDQTLAMKDTLILQEKEIQELRHELNSLRQNHQQESKDNQALIKKLQTEIRTLADKKEALKISCDELQQNLLLTQEEKKNLKKELDVSNSELLDVKFLLRNAQKNIEVGNEQRQQVELLQHELASMGEMYQRLDTRLDSMTPSRQIEEEMIMIRDASHKDIINMKQALDVKTAQYEACSARVSQLENQLANKDLQIAELKQLLEKLNVCHDEKLQSKDKRISALLNICQKMEVHMLELYQALEQRQLPHSETTERFEEISTSSVIDIENSPSVEPNSFLASQNATDLSPLSDLWESKSWTAASSSNAAVSESPLQFEQPQDMPVTPSVEQLNSEHQGTEMNAVGNGSFEASVEEVSQL